LVQRAVRQIGASSKLIGSAWFSSQKIEEKLGFKPEWNLEKAMPEMVAEQRQNAEKLKL
jgi:hypothetical protein